MDLHMICMPGKQVLPDCTDEFVMLLWMALGRMDSSHPFHTYLRSLPSSPQSMVLCPPTLWDVPSLLGNTNAGALLRQHRKLVFEDFAHSLSKLKSSAETAIPDGLNIDILAWAYDVYISRRFPEELGRFCNVEKTDIAALREPASDPQSRLVSDVKASAQQGSTPKKRKASALIPILKRRSNFVDGDSLLSVSCGGNEPEVQSEATGSSTAAGKRDEKGARRKSVCFSPLPHVEHKVSRWIKPDAESQPGSCSSLTHSLGIMVPVLDMFNHCHDSEVDWFSDESGVMCMRGDDPDDEDIPTGSEIFSNYGPKSNEMLLLLHGFAKFNNPNDTYALSIDVRFSDDPEDNGEIVIPNDDGGNNGNNVESLGVFHLRSLAHPDVLEGYSERIPNDLWLAMANPRRFLKQKKALAQLQTGSANESDASCIDEARCAEEGVVSDVGNEGTNSGEGVDLLSEGEEVNDGSARDASDSDDDCDDDGLMQIDVDMQSLSRLLQVVEARLAPFNATKEADTVGSACLAEDHNITMDERRVMYMHRYRDGQRKVLQDVVQHLASIMSGEGEWSESEAESEEEDGEGARSGDSQNSTEITSADTTPAAAEPQGKNTE
eukprot:INCI17555.8.p1 GENE.INCI17555.8~~INCI17555.8.p1  ORF type:complete len:607 (+),score=109.38 INCI17555.8:22-1842(+)